MFDGGRLAPADAKQRIVLQATELSAWRFTERHELDDLLIPRLSPGRRVADALDALIAHTTAYPHHGHHP
jgi:hypothetical protein